MRTERREVLSCDTESGSGWSGETVTGVTRKEDLTRNTRETKKNKGRTESKKEG